MCELPKQLHEQSTMSQLLSAVILFLLPIQLLVAGEPLQFDQALYSGPIGGSFRGGRSAVYVDPILGRLAQGTLSAPKEGDVSGTGFRGNEAHWRKVEMNDQGVFQMERAFGGYIYLQYEADEAGPYLFSCNGNTELIVNGVLRAGDYYGQGWIIHPVELQKGLNEFWYKVGRGRNKSVSLERRHKPTFLTPVDTTLPDLLTREIDEKWGAIRVINATDRTLTGLRITSNVAGKTSNTSVNQTVTPMTSRKIPFKLRDGANGPGKQAAEVSLFEGDRLVDSVVVDLEVKEPTKPYKRTFFSDVDGSLQYYGVRQGQAETGRKPAMFLSVHGAGVKAVGQAAAYQNKDWGHIIAPTNRREFGFSWEDWGRLDAMEAFAHAEAAYGTDPVRTYLTGHSMGGHGAWYLGATYPDRWAAIAPMAGWRSFFTYVRRRSADAEEPTPMEAVLDRAMNSSRTSEMIRNHKQHGVFIEHGDADNTVPVREARAMREQLAKFHPSLGYHEEPGGGHWYGIDHQRTFEFFEDHEKTDIRDLDEFEFRIASPGISSSCRYVTLYQQEKPFEFCGVVAKQTIRSRRQRQNEEDITERRMQISTENLACFRVDLAHCMDLTEFELSVDEQVIDNLPWPDQDHVWLRKVGGQWSVIDKPSNRLEKNPARYGGFKDAFNHRFVLVYSTGGDQAENTWSYNKARFDAETFYYRGNSAMDIIPDSQFSLDEYTDRSVILYGNATINKAWPLLLDDCPVQVQRGSLRVGDRTYEGNDLGLYMVRPRTDSDIASVGVVAGTGLKGMAAANPNRYFIAGPGFPDLMVVTPDVFTEGVGGVVAAGYFANDWAVGDGIVFGTVEDTFPQTSRIR